MMMVMTISANAMSYNAAKNEALFLSDKMAYELNLTAAQYEAVYEINLDYLMSLNGHGDVFGTWWNRRNADLRYVLNSWQYDKYVALSHFYRPVAWKAGVWTFAVYAHYNRGHFYNAHPKVFVTYKGGNSHRDPRFYADRHMPKPAAHHHSSCASCTCSASPKGSSECWQASRYYKPHLGKQHSAPRPQQRRSLRTQIKSTFCLYICLQKRTHGNSQKWEFPFFLYVKPITALNLVNHVSLTYL